VLLVSLVSLALGTVGAALGAIVFTAGSTAIVIGGVQLFLAKGKAIKTNDVVIWNGFARLISWNPTEAL
jgi:hypothetical protein